MMHNTSSVMKTSAEKLPRWIVGASRAVLVVLPLLFLTQCFQISHILDLKDDGSMDVRWVFRFSKALEQAQQGQQQAGEKKRESLGDMMEKEKKELPESLKGLVKNLAFKKIESEFDAGMEVSFLVPDYAKFPFGKIKKEEFPLIPSYFPDKKQMVFHFEPMEKKDEKKKEKLKPGTGKGDAGEAPASTDQSMEQMGKQITQLFLSSVRYQIFLGKKFSPEKVIVKKGSMEKNVDIQRIGDVSMIDLPLFALFGEEEEPFDMIVLLK
ncbi:MAG: hypothetical protein JXA07_10750 [Spirochaetes bacterium]|nr:hypothetical protein [Spirochaetota bacterium]